MARKFLNPANNHEETVTAGSSFAAFFLGIIYLAYKGLWGHVFIWLLVVALPGVLSGGPLLVIALPLASICYALGIQSILATRYLSRGWREATSAPTYDEQQLAAATQSLLSTPDPMQPRTKLGASAGATKICPYCAEEVKAAAIRCKHCQADLSVASATMAGSARS